MTNIGPGGSLDTDKVTAALLQYLNTPLRGINKSPAQLAAGRQLRDGVPTAKQHYKVDIHWRKILRDREVQLADTHQDIMNKKGTQDSRVWIQNQVTINWDRSGTVIEALRHRQYIIIFYWMVVVV